MQSSSQIIATNKPTFSFLQAGCPSCRPTNSVKAPKGKLFKYIIQLFNIQPIFTKFGGQVACGPWRNPLDVGGNLQSFQVPGSSHVKDALGDMIRPAPPVLRSLFNLIPADAHFPEIFLDDIFPVLSQSTWSPETLMFPCESLSRKSMVIHSWKMSKPS